MVSGCTWQCRKCNYLFHAATGVGFLFPQVYKETLDKAKNGELGSELETFFKDYKDGAIDASNTVLCCERCGALKNEMDLTMYVPKNKLPNKKNEKWSVAFPFNEEDYVTPWDLEDYMEYSKYPHKCEECGGNMQVVEDILKIACPICKEPLEIIEDILWD